MMSLKDLVDAQMRNGINSENQLYEQYVVPALSNPDAFDLAYTQYQQSLGGFNTTAFRKCVNHIVDGKIEDAEEYADWADQFNYIAEYATARNNFDNKVKEIFEMDGTQSEKQAIFDTLDRARTKAHNGVIMLFNNLNKLADEKQWAKPYPTDKPFDPQNPRDRESVATILIRQEPLLDTVHYYLDEQKTQQSEMEKMRSMSITELKDYALQKAAQLTESDLSGLEEQPLVKG